MPRDPRNVNWRQLAKPTPPGMFHRSNHSTVLGLFYLGVTFTLLSAILTLVDTQNWPTFIFAIGFFVMAGIAYLYWRWMSVNYEEIYEEKHREWRESERNRK
ncbi:MAG: hypothetical protein DPW16_08050 [Chloroflexi bacterium]|nr:hypothetical protein [Chloroflexota bacterium]